MSSQEDQTTAPQHYTITRNINYQIRWKVMQMKLLLSDLRELKDKYGLNEANNLYEIVRADCNEYLKELAQKIFKRKKQIEAIKEVS